MVDAISTIVAPLFVPADRPDRFAKAAASGADAVILDLEDAVAPERKDVARRAIQIHGIDRLPVIIRINAGSSEYFEADLAALDGVLLAAVMLAKAERSEDLERLRAALPPDIPLLPLVETARGLDKLPDLLGAANVSRVAFGALDFSLDLGCQPSWEALLLARSETVWRSRAADRAAPLDSPSLDLDDITCVRDEATRAAGLGFGGKLSIHPRQVEPIQQAFRPDDAAVTWARRVVAASENGGVIRVNGQMVDKPVLDRARIILTRAGPG